MEYTYLQATTRGNILLEGLATSWRDPAET
jgi:hypothetical protein